MSGRARREVSLTPEPPQLEAELAMPAADPRSVEARRAAAAAALADLERLHAARAAARQATAEAEPQPVQLELIERLRDLEYVVVDVETTGGASRHGHRVTEVAALCVDGRGRVLDEFQTLVNPERPIPPFITRLTNITDAMVRDAPRFADIAEPLRALLRGRVFVAHNAQFDWGFIGAELERATGRRPRARRLCTVRLARKVVPEVSSRSLDALSYYFGFENPARHRAYGDARVTADLLDRLLERCEEREIDCWSALDALLNRRKPRRKKQAMPTSIEEV